MEDQVSREKDVLVRHVSKFVLAPEGDRDWRYWAGLFAHDLDAIVAAKGETEKD